MTTRVPDGVTSADAFNALYENAKITNRFADIRWAGQPAPVYFPESAIQMFHAYCRNRFCSEVRGKLLNVDWKNFPELDVAGYDKQYGKGAAEKALKKAPIRTTEHSNLFVDPCTYFTGFWKNLTPLQCQQDLQEMFEQCAKLRIADESIDEQVKRPSPLRSHLTACRASYEVEHDGKKTTTSAVNCQEAAKEIEALIDKGQLDALIHNFSACRHHEPFSFVKSCIREQGILSVKSAKKAVDAQID